ncbi:50S ribosomal protein L4 [Aestuariispira ectoiniformans]|uniref:50S ribosomal protein L4 n=1 Tax=Aestuariispira ectoiniformans TaxID=2775080 RepID=UPI00223AD870|nr:50S ribosomal protein L4 [Aestuariispira ectoiniformans]
MKAKVITLDNKAAGDIELADEVFGVPVRKDILARMVNYQLAKRRAGTHKVKNRSEVNATGAKMFRQKGTGRARHGDAKVSQFRGGGRAFGPVVRDHGHSLPKKVRQLALKSALSAKQADGKLIILDDAAVSSPKTAELLSKLTGLGLSNALIVSGNEVDGNFALASRNVVNVDVLPTQGANVYDILRRDTLVLTKAAVEGLEARLK